MKGSAVAALAALLLLAAPAAAQSGDAARMERVAAEAGRWSEQLNAALAAASEGFDELNRKVQALVASGATRERVAEAAPGLRRLIEQSRENVRRSDSMLQSLPAYPSAMPADIAPDRVVAEVRGQNRRMLEVLDHYEILIVAMAAGDAAGVERARPRLMEGVFSLLGQQRLMFRNRQASIPADESSHQALGIASQIYRAMVAVGTHGLAARAGDGSGAAAAASALRDELEGVARDSRALAAAGRSNLKRELAEFEALRRGSTSDPAQARLAERAIAATALEERSFEIGDRLAAYADSKAGLTARQLREAGPGSLLTPLTLLESEFMDVAVAQTAVASDGPK